MSNEARNKLRPDHDGLWVPNRVLNIYLEVSGGWDYPRLLKQGRDLNRFLFLKVSF